MMTAHELERLIRSKCRECSGTTQGAKTCALTGCALWPALHRERLRKRERVADGVQLGIRGITIRIEVDDHD